MNTKFVSVTKYTDLLAAEIVWDWYHISDIDDLQNNYGDKFRHYLRNFTVNQADFIEDLGKDTAEQRSWIMATVDSGYEGVAVLSTRDAARSVFDTTPTTPD